MSPRRRVAPDDALIDGTQSAGSPTRGTPQFRDAKAIELAAEKWQENGWPVGPHFLASLAIVRAEEVIRTVNHGILSQYGLTHSRHEALAVLYFSRNGELPMGKLGEHLMVHPTSVTFTVDALTNEGLVERVPHPTDRRTTLARVTEKGRDVMERTSKALLESKFALPGLSDEDAAEVFRLLSGLGSASDASPSAP